MIMSLRTHIIFCCILLCGLCAGAVTIPVGDSLHRPEFYGTLRVNYAVRTCDGAGQFLVKNAIVGLSGKIIPELGYKIEMDLDNHGKMKMRNAYALIAPASMRFSATAGLMRVPFGIDVMRSPHLLYFPNRSFVAKHGGNVRDVGVNAKCQLHGELPVVFQAGVFQGNSLREKTRTWTTSYVFHGMMQARVVPALNVVASVMRTRPDISTVMLYGLGASYNSTLWHFEAEGVYKHYTKNVGTQTVPLNNTCIVNTFAVRNFPIKRMSTLNNVAALCRYDYISRNSVAKTLAEVAPAKHRISLSTNLRFGLGQVYAETRLSFEKYFFPGCSDTNPNEDKVTIEVMCRF